jgi:membrane protein DedA with SNARE-associated domain
MEHLLVTWGYLALFVAVFVSSMGIPVGSEVAIGYAGVLASGHVASSSKQHLSLVLVIIIATLGEVVGSLVGYAIGRFGGRPLVNKVGKYILLTHEDLDRAEAWFARRGEPVVFFGRFIPLLRSFISIAAGLGEMGAAKFLAFTTLACAMWSAGLASLGYSLGGSWERVHKNFSYVGYVVAILFVIAVGTLFVHRIKKIRAERSAPREVEKTTV